MRWMRKSMFELVLPCCLCCGIDPSFGSFDRQSKRIHHNHRVTFNLSLQHSHDLQTSTGHGVHHHLDQRHIADFHLRKTQEERKRDEHTSGQPPTHTLQSVGGATSARFPPLFFFTFVKYFGLLFHGLFSRSPICWS